MADLNSINSGLISGVTGGINVHSILNAVGWIVFILVAVGGFCVFYFIIWRNKKIFNKKITAFEIVGQYWTPTIRDLAKTVKLGKGGFEILYLKKQKVWRIAYGGRVGRDTYYFYIMPDGYWYNGMMSARLNEIDKQNGLIPIVTTNPLMRGQYTALEKQVDAFDANKKSFWDQNKAWIIALVFVLIIGVLAWLIYKEMATYSGNMMAVIDKEGQILDKFSTLAGNIKVATTTSGLAPAVVPPVA